jgi:hypothetical protein
LSEGKTVHGAGPGVGAGVGLSVGLGVGFGVGAVVGFAGTSVRPGFLVGSGRGWGRGSAVAGGLLGAASGPEVGVRVDPGVGTARLSFQTAEAGMAVGPTAAKVVEPAIDECGPPVAPAAEAGSPSCARGASRTRSGTTASPSTMIARSPRRSITGMVGARRVTVDEPVVPAAGTGGPVIDRRSVP